MPAWLGALVLEADALTPIAFRSFLCLCSASTHPSSVTLVSLCRDSSHRESAGPFAVSYEGQTCEQRLDELRALLLG